jgi:hypothetical protein
LEKETCLTGGGDCYFSVVAVLVINLTCFCFSTPTHSHQSYISQQLNSSVQLTTLKHLGCGEKSPNLITVLSISILVTSTQSKGTPPPNQIFGNNYTNVSNV